MSGREYCRSVAACAASSSASRSIPCMARKAAAIECGSDGRLGRSSEAVDLAFSCSYRSHAMPLGALDFARGAYGCARARRGVLLGALKL